MILVTGATGTIGSELVRILAARGEKVRALTRDPSADRVPSGAEVVRGDYRDPASLREAMAGVSAAFLVGVPGPDAQHDETLVSAARAAGVGRLVKLSAIGTGEPDLGSFGAWHVPGERAVRESGAAWTILRPSSFASNTLSWAGAVSAGEPVPNMSGAGRQGVIDPRDIAEVAAVALADERHAGRTYTLTGPEAISVHDQAATLAAVLGRPVTARDLSPEETREYLAGWGLTERGAEDVLASMAYVRADRNAVVTDDVRDALGRPPRSYEEWARDHRELFGEG